MPLAEEFPQSPDLIYLNHAAVSPWPRRTRDAVCRFAEESMRQGARDYPRWVAVETRLRQQLAQLIGAADEADIALLKNTSEALSVIAWGLDWREGDEVVLPDVEFPSNRIVWESLAPLGVRVRCVSLAGADPEQALLDAVGPRTRLLSTSAIQYGNGLRMDLPRLGRVLRRRGVLFCVDAIQQLGMLPFQVTEAEADFVVADGHKWMLGPEGLALFWCRPEHRETLQLRQFGWHMVAALGDYDRRDWRPADSARRFECGSPNLLGAHALSASLSLLLETGMEQVADQARERAEALHQGLQRSGRGQLLSPADPARRSAIITWQPDEDLTRAHARLTAAGLICARRGGGLRCSPHFYTTAASIDRALTLLLA